MTTEVLAKSIDSAKKSFKIEKMEIKYLFKGEEDYYL